MARSGVHKAYRFLPEDVAVIDELAKIWGGVSPISATQVIREATRRCLEIERSKASPKKSKKIPN